jgi:hypothetical protein
VVISAGAWLRLEVGRWAGCHAGFARLAFHGGLVHFHGGGLGVLTLDGEWRLDGFLVPAGVPRLVPDEVGVELQLLRELVLSTVREVDEAVHG